MPSISDENTITALAKAYIKCKHNKTQAMIDIGYTKAYAKSRSGGKLWANPKLKAAIAELEAENQAEYKHTIDAAIKLLTDALSIAKKQSNPAGMVSAIREMDNICGLNQTTVITDTKPPAELTPEQVQELQKAAGIATGVRLSKSG